MQVIVDGILTSYQKTGSAKKAVLLIHGWGDSKETFTNLAKQLEKKYELLSLDLPGFGSSEPPPAAWGLNDYAKFVNAWLTKINGGHLNAVIGHSFGGSVAIVGASSGQIKSDKLILLASGGVRNKNFVKKKALWLAAKTLKAPFILLPSGKSSRIKTRLYKNIGSDLLVIPHMRQTFVKMVREDVQLPARKIKQPTLLIYGDKDKDTPISYGRLLSDAIPGSSFVVVHGTGHFLHHEKPQKIAQLIEDFIR